MLQAVQSAPGVMEQIGRRARLRTVAQFDERIVLNEYVSLMASCGAGVTLQAATRPQGVAA
jgi:hypothetical protein